MMQQTQHTWAGTNICTHSLVRLAAQDAVKESAALITECCQGLLQFLTEVADEAAGTAAAAAVSGTNGAAHKQGSSFRRLLTERIKNMDTIAW